MPRTANVQDVIGKKYGRLTVNSFARMNKKGERVYLCSCECGSISEKNLTKLKNGGSKSCGCLPRELAAIRAKSMAKEYLTTHGHSGTRTYISWKTMKRRVLPGYHEHKYYNDKGISVCKRWAIFENFLNDMGERPIGKTLDRINPNGNYEPSNCRWATLAQQANNKRDTKRYVYKGVDYTVSELSTLLGIEYQAIWYQLKKNGGVVDLTLFAGRSCP